MDGPIFITKLGYFDTKEINQEFQIKKIKKFDFFFTFSLLPNNKNEEVQIKIYE